MEKGLLSKLVYSELTTTQKLTITGGNFHFWKLKIPFLLADHELQHLLEPPSPETETSPMSTCTTTCPDQEEDGHNYDFAVKLIYQTLDDGLLVESKPYNRHKAKSMLYSLFTRFEKSRGRFTKIREYMNHRMATGADINQHIFRMRAMAKELEMAGIKFPDESQAIMLLGSLPEDREQDVEKWLRDLDERKEELSFDNVSRRLLIKKKVVVDQGKLDKVYEDLFRDSFLEDWEDAEPLSRDERVEEASFGNLSAKLPTKREKRKKLKVVSKIRYVIKMYMRSRRSHGLNQSNRPQKEDNEEAAIPAGASKKLTEKIYPALKTSWKLTYAGLDFYIWSSLLESVLLENGVEYVLKDPKPCEGDAELYMKWQKDDFICRHLILGVMDDDLFLSFHDYPTAKTLMEAVEACFNPSLLTATS